MSQPYKQPTAADIILQQLGGQRRLKIVMGAKDFFSDGKYNQTLVFKFTCRAKEGINYIRITLNSNDTYDLEFIKIGRKKDKELGIFLPVHNVVNTFQGAYAEMLASVINSHTGLIINPRFQRVER
jgi:hypothetical protein